MDWKADIVRMVYWKQEIADHDSLGAFPWHLPGPAATEDEIVRTELAAGVTLPAGYRSFLKYGNGWRGLLNTTDLFSTGDFLARRHEVALLRGELKKFIDDVGKEGAEVIIIGTSELDLDVFLAISDQSELSPGGVIWFANEEVERYASFYEFFGSMVNYNADTAKELIKESRGAGL